MTFELLGLIIGVLSLALSLLQLHLMGYSLVPFRRTATATTVRRPWARAKLVLLIFAIVASLLLITWRLLGDTVRATIIRYLPELRMGIARTLAVSAVAILLGTLVGGAVAYVVTSNDRSRWLAAVRGLLEYSIYVMLALPVIVVIYIVYYSMGRVDALWMVATLALAINLSPFVAKILIGSIRSIPRQQIEAARAFGYKDRDIARFFKIRYVVAVSAQSLLVEYYTTIKLSSLTAAIGYAEVLHVSQDIIKETQDPVTAYIVLALCYTAIVMPLAVFADYLERSSRAKRHEA